MIKVEKILTYLDNERRDEKQRKENNICCCIFQGKRKAWWALCRWQNNVSLSTEGERLQFFLVLKKKQCKKVQLLLVICPAFLLLVYYFLQRLRTDFYSLSTIIYFIYQIVACKRRIGVRFYSHCRIWSWVQQGFKKREETKESGEALVQWEEPLWSTCLRICASSLTGEDTLVTSTVSSRIKLLESSGSSGRVDEAHSQKQGIDAILLSKQSQPHGDWSCKIPWFCLCLYRLKRKGCM